MATNLSGDMDKTSIFLGINAEDFLSEETEQDFIPINGPKKEEEEASEFAIPATQQQHQKNAPKVIIEENTGPDNNFVPLPKNTCILEHFCQVCNGRFGSRSLLNQHISLVHPADFSEINPLTEAQESDAIFTERHRRLDGSANICQLSLCNFRFRNRARLISHFAAMHQVQPNTSPVPKSYCNICDTSFNSMAEYVVHRRRKHSMGLAYCSLKESIRKLPAHAVKKRPLKVKVVDKDKKLSFMRVIGAKGKSQRSGKKTFELTSTNSKEHSPKQSVTLLQDDVDVFMPQVDPSKHLKDKSPTNLILRDREPLEYNGSKTLLGNYPCRRCHLQFITWKARKQHYVTTHMLPPGVRNTIHCRSCRANFNGIDSYEKHKSKCERKSTLVAVKMKTVRPDLEKISKEREPVENFGVSVPEEEIVIDTVPPPQKPRSRKQNLELCEDEEIVVKKIIGTVPRTYRMEDLARIIPEPRSRKQKQLRACDRSKEPQQFPCKKCGKEFSHHSGLLYHNLAFHKQEKMFSCKQCDKRYNYPHSLYRHRLFNHNSNCKPKAQINEQTPRDYELFCDDCGKGFGSRSSLFLHVRIHTGYKPYVCNYCGKRFADKTNKRVHSRIHTGENPYVCNICGKRFNSSSNHKTHLVTHCTFGDS